MGAGFAGVECVRRLERRLAPGEADVALVTPFSYQLYLPLLPQVASGVLTPQSVAVSLRRSRKYRTRIIPGGAIGVDAKAKVCVIRKITGEIVNERYDHIVLAPGSITRTFDIPGLTDNARGMKTLAEAAYIRDHVIAQLDLADASHDEEERASRLQFVVVGGGYAGTETAACLQRLTSNAVKRYPRLDPAADQVAPDRHRAEADARTRRQTRPQRAGDPARARHRGLARGLDRGGRPGGGDLHRRPGDAEPHAHLDGRRGRQPAGRHPGRRDRARAARRHPGDDGARASTASSRSATPRPYRTWPRGTARVCPPTAQHSMRQGRDIAENVIASLRGRPLQPYVHKDLGLVVDLGGRDAVSKPLGIELRGLPAQAVARGYHWSALRTNVAKTRVMTNWMLNAIAGDDFVRTGFLSQKPATLRDFEYTDEYLTAEQVREHTASMAARG